MELKVIPEIGTWGEAQAAIQENFNKIAASKPDSGVYVVILRSEISGSTTTYYLACIDVNKWDSSYAENTLGVLVAEGDKRVIVGKNNLTARAFATTDATVITSNLTKLEALSKFDGEQRTALFNASEYDTPIATECVALSVLSSGKDKGKWWIPSLGELDMIIRNRDKVNYALNIIGGTPINYSVGYWSSSELSKTSMWRIFIQQEKSGIWYAGGGHKLNTTTFFARPVTNFFL